MVSGPRLRGWLGWVGRYLPVAVAGAAFCGMLVSGEPWYVWTVAVVAAFVAWRQCRGPLLHSGEGEPGYARPGDLWASGE